MVAAAVIAVHHLSFNYLQAAGYPVYVFDHGTSLGIVLTHAAYVVFETALLCFMALNSRKEFLETRAALRDIAATHSEQQQLITVRCPNRGSGCAKRWTMPAPTNLSTLGG